MNIFTDEDKWTIHYLEQQPSNALMQDALRLINRLGVSADKNQDAKDHILQQAKNWKCEAKCQRSIVIGILRELGLPENDWEADSLILGYIRKIQGLE